MSDEDSKERKGGSVWWLVGVVLLPVLYVLSAGPGSRLFTTTSHETLYRPLYWAGDRTGLGNVFRRYVNYWSPVTEIKIVELEVVATAAPPPEAAPGDGELD